MDSRPDEPWNDAWIEQLVQYDEALRQGGNPARDESAHSALAQTQQFLHVLQSVWPRSSKKIGPYPLVRNLGQGAVGPSYLVEDPATRQPLVLKILWPDLSAHAETRRQFVADARAVQRLQHEGIAAVRAVRDAGPLCIVVRAYCGGVSLAQWRRNRPQPIAWEVSARFVLRLADLLQLAHGQGIVHGDVKPSNLFLTHGADITPANMYEAKLQVTDFGLTQAVQQTRVPSQGGLSWPLPQFLAPEQLQHRSKAAEPACDLYALGVIWYDLLTGRCPVKGTTREQILAHLLHADPPGPRQYRPEVPAEVEALVLQCLRRKPRERPASAQHLADAVRALLPAATQETPAWWKNWLGWL